MLRLVSGRLYGGSTSNLRQRIGDHFAGIACRTTTIAAPVRLEYVEPCMSLSAARLRETQLKRWSAAKKEALVAGDLERLRILARRRRSDEAAR
jgi:putative endonuclease